MNSAKFPELFGKLEDEDNEFKVNHYGLSTTTLEQVFLKIGNVHNILVQDQEQQKQLFEQPTFQLAVRSEAAIFVQHVGAILFKMAKWQSRDWNTIFWRILYPPFLTFLTIVIMYYSMPQSSVTEI